MEETAPSKSSATSEISVSKALANTLQVVEPSSRSSTRETADSLLGFSETSTRASSYTPFTPSPCCEFSSRQRTKEHLPLQQPFSSRESTARSSSKVDPIPHDGHAGVLSEEHSASPSSKYQLVTPKAPPRLAFQARCQSARQPDAGSCLAAQPGIAVGQVSKSPTRKAKESVADFHDIVKMRRQLSKRIDRLEDHGVDSARCHVSEEATQRFGCFIKGYARNARRSKQLALHPLVGEAEIDTGRISPCLKDVGDHYQYFTRIQADSKDIASREEHARRLQHTRLQRVRDRTIMISRRREVKQCKQSGNDVKPQPVVIFNSEQHSDLAEPGSPMSFMKPRLACQDATSPKAAMEAGLTKNDERMLSKSKGKVNGEAEKIHSRRGTNGRLATNSKAATAALKAEMRTREACESLRFLVFGTDGMTSRGKDSGGAFYEQRCGTREEILQLYSVWNQMDEDGSGDVEFEEFLSFFSKSKADRLLGMRCVKYLVGNLKDNDENEEPDGCRIEDMMKLIWLKATDGDIHKMMQYFREAEFRNDRSKTPPLLPPKKRREVIENFPKIHESDRSITFEDLVQSGLVDQSMASDLQARYDPDNTNVITEALLLEMLCPNGYLAHNNVKTCFDAQGQPLVHVSTGLYTGWVASHKAFKWKQGAARRASIAYRGSTIFDM